MITGSIKKYEEPAKYNTYQGMLDGDEGWQYMYQGMSNRYQAPPHAKQAEILQEAVDTARLLGFHVGARVKRRNGIDNLGTIIHIHQFFSQAFNYSTGELEPFKVQWDTKQGTTGGAFDYGIQDLDVVEPEKVVIDLTKKDEFHEGLPHLYQSC